jgi:lipid II:glycine glycyltransferase (peptidoglycan interpeptide bridge formation enzyme)
VALSSNFLLGYGDSTVYKAGGWSGTRGNIRPNELLHWAGMQWGRARGHHYYDFEGVERSIGRALLSGHPRTSPPTGWRTSSSASAAT